MNFAELVHDYADMWIQGELAGVMEVVEAYCRGLVGMDLSWKESRRMTNQLSRQYNSVNGDRAVGKAVKVHVPDMGVLALLACPANPSLTENTGMTAVVGARLKVATLQDEELFVPVYSDTSLAPEVYLHSIGQNSVRDIRPSTAEWRFGHLAWSLQLRSVDPNIIPDPTLRAATSFIVCERGRELTPNEQFRGRIPSVTSLKPIERYYAHWGLGVNTLQSGQEQIIPQGEWVGLVYR